MDWSQELRTLRGEVDSLRRERQRQSEEEEVIRQQHRAETKALFQTLRIEQALGEMNRALLDGAGGLEVFSPGEPGGDLHEGQDDEDEMKMEEEEEVEEESESMAGILTWEERGAREIEVDLGITDGGPYLEVNGTDIRLEEEAVRQALIQAFKDEMGL